MSSPGPKLLFVDDDPNLLAALRRTLRSQFAFDTALGGEEALQLIQTAEPYAVVVADMNMPGMNGIELLERVREISPDTIAVMLTGNADQQTAVDSVNRGHVVRFLNKPCPPEAMIPALQGALQQYLVNRAERELLEGTLTGAVKLLTDVLGTVAPDALGRGQRLRLSIGRFVRQTGLAPVWEFELAALFAGIGYAAVPPLILQKIAAGTPLAMVEEKILRRVPKLGHDLLSGIPRLGGVAQAVLYQHKGYDGSGRPDDGCAGEALPLAARLLRIFSDRIDLEADGIVKHQAFSEMSRRGCYDPKLLERCFAVFPTFLPSSISGDRQVLSVPLDQLEAGQVVVSDLCTHRGLVLVGAGHLLTETMLERIRNFGELGEVKEPILVQAANLEELAPTPVPARD